MDSRPWPDQLRHKLQMQNLPPAYIDRLVEELSDHLLDTQSETTSMDAHNAQSRLGSTDQIAAAATHEFRRRTFAGRHPWLTFVALPVAFVPLVFIASILAVFVIQWMVATTLEALIEPDLLFSLSEATHARVEWWILTAFDSYVRFVPFVIAAWMFCRWGRRSDMRWWPLVACTMVALTAGFLCTKSVPASGDQPGLWMVGLATHFELRQVIQLLVPLTVAAAMLLRLPRGQAVALTFR
jgi:hypothetical protein